MNFETDQGILRRMGILEFNDFPSALRHYSKLKYREYYEVVLLKNGLYRVQLKGAKND